MQGKELIARVHLQMQLGKRRIELEVRISTRLIIWNSFVMNEQEKFLYV